MPVRGETWFRRLLLKKPGKSSVSDDYEMTPEELEQVYCVDSTPPKHDGILLKGQIVLFGTCHPLQFGERSDADSHQFQNELKRVCREHDIQLITEECTEDVTPQRPLVQEVARDLDLKYVPVVISLEDRLKLKITDANLSDVTLCLGPGGFVGPLRDTLTQCLSNRMRECCWYARILACCIEFESRSTLFIYGANHTAAMCNLIEHTGMKVIVARHDCPQK